VTITSLNWDLRFAQMAKLVSLWSKDPSTKVGSVIVRPDKTIASVGFNGFPRGVPDNPEDYADRAKKLAITKHAEENAILFSRELLDGYTIYIYPLPPCTHCAGDIIQRGIKRVVSIVPTAQRHRLSDPIYCFDLALRMFDQAGVTVDLIHEEVDLSTLELKE
jgi:dCMP deaminase